ncbi:MAG: recombination protein NinB [Rhizomicrobium sp.]
MSDRAIFFLRSPEIRERVCAFIRSAPDGYRVEIKEQKRTLDQNAKLWPMLQDVSAQVEWYGQKLSPDDWKDVFSASLRRARVVPGLDAGTFVPLGMRTSDMSKQEFSDLIELIYAFGAAHGVMWSDPAIAHEYEDA